MRKPRILGSVWLLASAAFLALLMFSAAPARAGEGGTSEGNSDEKVALELPFAEWSQGYATLEDFKGQLTVLMFFDDDSG